MKYGSSDHLGTKFCYYVKMRVHEPRLKVCGSFAREGKCAIEADCANQCFGSLPVLGFSLPDTT